MKSDKGNKSNSWNHITVIHKTSAQHTWKSRNQETTKNSHTVYRARNWISSNGRYKMLPWELALHVPYIETLMPYIHGLFHV
jgi:hypothetical protein